MLRCLDEERRKWLMIRCSGEKEMIYYNNMNVMLEGSKGEGI